MLDSARVKIDEHASKNEARCQFHNRAKRTTHAPPRCSMRVNGNMKWARANTGDKPERTPNLHSRIPKGAPVVPTNSKE